MMNGGTINIAVFAVGLGGYFLIAPVGIVLLYHWLTAKHNMYYYAVLSLIGIGAISWGVTAALVLGANHIAPGLLRPEIIRMGLWCGWSCCFATSVPGLLLAGAAGLLTRKKSVRVRISSECIASSLPYIILLSVWIPFLAAAKV